MNESEYFKANDDGIGMDPTMMPVIESLDVEPPSKDEDPKGKKKAKPKKKKSTTPNPDKKPGDLLKKIMFTVVVLLLMAGVSFGVYYYLSLGRHGGKGKFTLNDKVIFVGDPLPTSVMDYGDFSTVDVTECKINVDDVNINEAGEYDYSIVCGKAKYSAKIIVQEKIYFDIATKVVYKTLGETAVVKEFIETEREDYTFAFVNEAEVTNALATTGGPHVIEIKVINENGEETIVNGLLYVQTEDAMMFLTCDSGEQSGDTYDYIITDKIAFNHERNNMGDSLRSYKYTIPSAGDYELLKSQITSGELTIGDQTGYALINNLTNQITLVSVLTNETLNEEYGQPMPSAYNDINSYYRNTKKYSCSI